MVFEMNAMALFSDDDRCPQMGPIIMVSCELHNIHWEGLRRPRRVCGVGRWEPLTFKVGVGLQDPSNHVDSKICLTCRVGQLTCMEALVTNCGKTEEMHCNMN